MGRLYRPRMAAFLVVPERTDNPSFTVRLPVRVQSAKLDVNDHNHADELKLTLDWYDAGTDPRLISSAQVLFYLGCADDDDAWEPTEDDLRFAGIMTRPMRKASEGELSVEAEFLDYTHLFLKAKPFATKGVPDYSCTLQDAWWTILKGFKDENTGKNPLVFLDDALEFRGLDAPGPVIGNAVADRFKKLGKVPVNATTDAWAVWQQCVGMLGLISFWDRDKLVVTTATDLYTSENPPTFVWGKNILEFEEERNNDFERKGIGVTSFDPLTGTTIEALWPPVGDPSLQKKALAPKKKANAAELAATEQRDYFQFPGVTDPDALLELAKRVHAERSRQEMTGKIKTAEMVLGTEQGDDFDLLKLRSGDLINIRIDSSESANGPLANASTAKREAYFRSRGYSQGAAELMAKNYDDLVRDRADFYVKAVSTTLESSEEGGSFSVEIEYCNKIQPSGEAKATHD